MRATPHARGSTLAVALKPLVVSGYPACAGIDLVPLCSQYHYTRLPRMRGDRPFVKQVIKEGKRATPHARGSTSQYHKESRYHQGYPACAGIDPR